MSNSRKKKINLFNYYSKTFKNKSTIPTSKIINYMKQNFSKYDILKNQLEQENKYIIELDDCFDFKRALIPGLRQFSFDSPINSNPEFSIDKLISYAFYTKTRFAFIDEKTKEPTDKDKYLETLKNQMGKDIRRDNRTINGVEYSSLLYSDQTKNNYNIADMFYQTLIGYFNRIKDIDFNIINKIALLSCQNIFNLITDLITLKINHLLDPEMNSVFEATKSADIIIEKDIKTMQFNFDSKLIISRDGEGMDPEYPCGLLSFKFLIDFTNNTFKFEKFKLEYNIDNCGPPKNPINNAANNENNNNYGKLKYAIPAALGVGAIVATPFLLGALGGKKYNKTKKYKKYNKTKKYKKYNKTKKYKKYRKTKKYKKYNKTKK